MAYTRSLRKTVLTLVPIPSEEEKWDKFLIFTVLFVASKKFDEDLPAFIKPFWGTAKKCENKNLRHLFISIDLGCLRQEGVIKFFSSDIFINMKLAFINPFRYNSACVVQKWLRFKGVVINIS